MKISYAWLKDYIDTDLTVDQVSVILTDTGLEVEGVQTYETIKGGLKGFVLGEVTAVEKHPDADRLNLTKVDVGGDRLLDIVCGASNVAVGVKVAVAMVGAEIHGDGSGDSFTIKKSKIRGAVSEGMLCAEDELGLGQGHEGILLLDTDQAPGTPLAEVLDIQSDQVIEIGLTPNRSDAISHIGVARDLAAFLSQEKSKSYHSPSVNLEAKTGTSIKVELEAPEACIRYTALELEGITVGPSPDWMQHRLKAIGLSPINNVVDITNYVMHETGQPLHAFDRDQIEGNTVKVRLADKGEEFQTLDEVTRKLDSQDLMIANEKSSMCIAGVFGGLKSGVSESTTSVFLESAVFDAVSVRKTAKRHGLNTDSSFRFERGVDPNEPLYALRRAAQLICELCGAQVTSEITDIYPEPVDPKQIDFDLKAAFKLIGQEIPVEQVQNILNSLDIKLLASNGLNWKIAIPTYRVDVTRQADVVEELLRIYGFNRIDLPSQLRNSIVHATGPNRHAMRRQLSQLLNGMGYSEIMCNSLSAAKYAQLLSDGESTAVSMLNPLSQDLAVLRQSMLWGALETIAYNQNRQMPDFKGFEFGSTYQRGAEGYDQSDWLSLFVSGQKEQENWDNPGNKLAYSDLQAVISEVLSRAGVQAKSETSKAELYSQSLLWKQGDKVIAKAGVVSASVRKAFDVRQDVYHAEIDWNYLSKKASKQKVKVKEIPKFPMVRRDLSLLLDKGIAFSQIETIALKQGGKLLKEVGLFDVYEGKNLPEGKKSYTLKFLIQDEQKTLVDKVVDKLMHKVQSTLEKELGAELRS